MWEVLRGDCLEVLPTLEAQSVHCVVTSPPYFGLRDYGVDGQLGLEETPAAYVAKLVGVFREVRRVLRDDGTVWLNLGDSYAGGKQGRDDADRGKRHTDGRNPDTQGLWKGPPPMQRQPPPGMTSKQLLGIPWRVAFALQDDGWILRSDIIWAKSNPMPESVKDRPTKAHEYIFLLAKQPRYYYDADAVREPAVYSSDYSSEVRVATPKNVNGLGLKPTRPYGFKLEGGRNRRSVWTVSTTPYRGAHFAVFPPKLIEPCVLAGCPEGGVVLDPFAGSGTTGEVAIKHGRRFVGIELNPEYIKLAEARLNSQPARLAV